MRIDLAWWRPGARTARRACGAAAAVLTAALLSVPNLLAGEGVEPAIAERPETPAVAERPFEPAEAERPHFAPAEAPLTVVPAVFEVAASDYEPAVAERPETADEIVIAVAEVPFEPAVAETPFEPAVAEVPDDAVVIVRDIGNVRDGMPASPSIRPETLEGQAALEFVIARLDEGSRKIAAVPDYTGEFFKRERVGGVLGSGTRMFVKLRHEPFSIYLKWLTGDRGREIIYVDGENDGEMLFHPGGWKARLLPPLKIRPDGPAALKESRHPVTQFGLVNLANRVIERRREDLARAEGMRVQIAEQTFDDRACWQVTVEYDSPAVSDFYRKAIVSIDQEYLIPVCVLGYGWPEAGMEIEGDLDETTLIEHYEYTSIRLNERLADLDFDRRNKAYNFRR